MKQSAKARARARYSLHLPKPLYRKIRRLALSLEIPARVVIQDAVALYTQALTAKEKSS